MYHAHWGSRALLRRAPALSLPPCQARPGPPRRARRLARPCPVSVAALPPPCSAPRPVCGASAVRPVVSCRRLPARASRVVSLWGRGGRGGSTSALALAPWFPHPRGARASSLLPPSLGPCHTHGHWPGYALYSVHGVRGSHRTHLRGARPVQCRWPA